MYFCRVCYSEIKNVGDLCHCMHCRMPFHHACISNYVERHSKCPQCKTRMTASSFVKGAPPARRATSEEGSPRRISVAETRRMPPIQPTRRIDLSERRKKINFIPYIVGMILFFALAGGGYLAMTRLPALLSSIEQQKPLVTPSSTEGPVPTAAPGESPPPATASPGEETWFSWWEDYLFEGKVGKTFLYNQEIYYSTRTVKSEIRWKTVNIVTLGSEKAILIEVVMTSAISETTKFESVARKWIGVESKKCIKVEYSTGGKRKEGDCAKSLFGAGVDLEAIPSWESSAKPQGKEEVTVPAGAFSATKVQIETTIDDAPAIVTLWYVEGRPPVKIEVYKEGKLYMLYVLVSSN